MVRKPPQPGLREREVLHGVGSAIALEGLSAATAVRWRVVFRQVPAVSAGRVGPQTQRWCVAAGSTAVADGVSCQQLVCGRETVCQRVRSILKSPVTLARPDALACRLPLAGLRSLFLVCSVRDSRGLPGRPQRGTENARTDPDSQPPMAGRLPQGYTACPGLPPLLADGAVHTICQYPTQTLPIR